MNYMLKRAEIMNLERRNDLYMRRVIGELREREDKLLSDLVKFNAKSERFPE
jgi:hypothetical protein